MKQDYLSYKKQKLNAEAQEVQQIRKNDKDPNQFPMFLTVFLVCLMLFVVFVAKYGSKVDIEYGKMGEGPYEAPSAEVNENLTSKEDINSGIDSRLKDLQDANRAGRVLGQKETVLKSENNKQEETKVQETSKEEKNIQKTEEVKTQAEKTQVEKKVNAPEEHRVVYSKVLLGHYSSYDEAKQAQAKLKADTGSVAFVRKMGSFYALQVGSYLDPEQAKVTAAKYSNMNYFVSIIEDWFYLFLFYD